MKAKVLNILVLVIGGIIVFNLTTNVIRLWQKRGGLAEEEKKLKELQVQNSKLRTQLEYVQSEEFIEKEAREKLGWAKKREEVWMLPKVIKDIKGTEDTEEAKEENWKKWVKLFFPE